MLKWFSIVQLSATLHFWLLEMCLGKSLYFLLTSATTHTDLWIRAKERNIPIQVIHNASIMNACACCGLQLYRFGQTISLCFFTETWRPDSFYERIVQNHSIGLHTLCLLGILCYRIGHRHQSEGTWFQGTNERSYCVSPSSFYDLQPSNWGAAWGRGEEGPRRYFLIIYEH